MNFEMALPRARAHLGIMRDMPCVPAVRQWWEVRPIADTTHLAHMYGAVLSAPFINESKVGFSLSAPRHTAFMRRPSCSRRRQRFL